MGLLTIRKRLAVRWLSTSLTYLSRRSFRRLISRPLRGRSDDRDNAREERRPCDSSAVPTAALKLPVKPSRQRGRRRERARRRVCVRWRRYCRAHCDAKQARRRRNRKDGY